MRRKTFLNLLASCVILTLTGFQGIHGENRGHSDLLVKLVKNKSIHRLYSAGESKRIFESGKSCITRVTVSPNGKFIGLIETEEGKGKGYAISLRNNLIVLNPEGKVVHSVNEDVRKYSWSPNGNRIAYITGTYYEGGRIGFKPTGVWIIDVTTGEKEQIDKSILSGQKVRSWEGGYKIFWAKHDSSIYVKDVGSLREVYRYDPSLRKIESTNLKDVYFSPDGEYYLRLWEDEAKQIQLYETCTNSELFSIRVYKDLLPSGDNTEPFPENIGALWISYSSVEPPYGWVFDQGHLLLFTKVNQEVKYDSVTCNPPGPEKKWVVKRILSERITGVENSLFDVQKREVVKGFSGNIDPWIGNGTKIIVERNGKTVFEEIPSVE